LNQSFPNGDWEHETLSHVTLCVGKHGKHLLPPCDSASSGDSQIIKKVFVLIWEKLYSCCCLLLTSIYSDHVGSCVGWGNSKFIKDLPANCATVRGKNEKRTDISLKLS